MNIIEALLGKLRATRDDADSPGNPETRILTIRIVNAAGRVLTTSARCAFTVNGYVLTNAECADLEYQEVPLEWPVAEVVNRWGRQIGSCSVELRGAMPTFPGDSIRFEPGGIELSLEVDD